MARLADLADLQLVILRKIRNGQITLEHLEWFVGLRKAMRDKLAGVDPR